MKLIVGLGNPGKKYKNTLHNLGMEVIKLLAGENNISLCEERKFNALVGQGVIGSQAVLLFAPLTYMNLSGEAVSKIILWKKISLGEVLIICDDADLECGSIRIRKSGSSGGHNGLNSIINLLGTKNFPRLRIGIGRNKKQELAEYVLSEITSEQRPLIDNAIEKSIMAVNIWLESGIVEAMNITNAGKS